MNNEFSIQVGIQLEDNGKKLVDRWSEIKKQIEGEGLNIKFGDSINTAIKEITNISKQIDSLSKQINSFGDKKQLEIFDTNKTNMSIKGTLSNLEQVQKRIKEMGLYSKDNEVKININGIDRAKNEIESFIVSIKELNGITKEISFIQKTDNGGLKTYEGAVSKIVDNTDKILKQSAEKEVQNNQKIQDAIGKTIQKREEENKVLEQNQASAINKSLDQEYKDREKIQEQINKTIKLREQENKTLEEKQAKASNKGLDENYNDIQKFTNQSIASLDKMQEKFKGLYSNLEFSKIKSELNNLAPNDSEFAKKIDNIKDSIKSLNSELLERQRIQSLGNSMGSFTSSGLNMSSNISDIEKYVKETMGAKASVTSLYEAEDKLGNKIKVANVSVNEGNNIHSKYKINLDEVTQSCYKAIDGVQNLSSKHATFTEKLKNSLSGIINFSIAGTAFFGTLRMISEGFSDIVELDNAMIDLKKVTDETSKTYENFTKIANDMAIAVGHSTTAAIDATTYFAKLGYSLQQSSELAKSAMIFSNIGDIDINESSTDLISIMKAYGIEAENINRIMDASNEIGNNFATSTGGVAEALKRGGSALNEANNSLEQSMGLIVAGNNSVQDPEKVGTALFGGLVA